MTEPYYADATVTLYHGDNQVILPSLPDASVDLILTDPPYNVTDFNGRDGTTVGKVKRQDGSYREVVKNFGDWDRGYDPTKLTVEAQRLLVVRGGLLVFTSDRLLGAYVTSGLHHMRTLIWLKSNPQPQFPGNYQSAVEYIVWLGNGGPPYFNGGGAVPNVLRAATPHDKSHPCEKPLGLVEKLIVTHSRAGDTVLDPFVGSGTTLRAAVDNGRKAIGIEVDERYCEIAAKRLQQGVLDFGGAA